MTISKIDVPYSEVYRIPRFPVSVVLDNIRSAFNIGSIFRSSDAALVSKIFLCGICTKPPNPKLLKTSLGAELSVPWEYHENTAAVVKKALYKKNAVFGVEITERSIDLWDVEFPENIFVVFGNEVTGISPDVLNIIDRIIQIPVMGIKNSLNVSTSFGIVIYEIIRQYRLREIAPSIIS